MNWSIVDSYGISFRRFLGINQEPECLDISRKRKLEIKDISNYLLYQNKIKDLAFLEEQGPMLFCEEEA